MALVCYRCKKRTSRGNLVSHSGIRTRRSFRPNLHYFWAVESGKEVRRKFCTKCLRIVKQPVAPVVASE